MSALCGLPFVCRALHYSLASRPSRSGSTAGGGACSPLLSQLWREWVGSWREALCMHRLASLVCRLRGQVGLQPGADHEALTLLAALCVLRMCPPGGAGHSALPAAAAQARQQRGGRVCLLVGDGSPRLPGQQGGRPRPAACLPSFMPMASSRLAPRSPSYSALHIDLYIPTAARPAARRPAAAPSVQLRRRGGDERGRQDCVLQHPGRPPAHHLCTEPAAGERAQWGPAGPAGLPRKCTARCAALLIPRPGPRLAFSSLCQL